MGKVNNLMTNIGHIVIAIVVITAAVVLSIKGRITGGEAIAMIAASGGFSLGGAVASSSAGAPVPSSVASFISKSAPTPTATPASTDSTGNGTATTPSSETAAL